jgi:hypothetical protein
MKRLISSPYLIFFVLATFNLHFARAQYSLTLPNYSQDFNGLGTGSSTVAGGNLNLVDVTLNGWYFSETGSGANTTITAGTGSDNTGDTYNFGTALAGDRTLGGLQSGTLVSTFGFYFTNNTGSTITSLALSYTGEQWRLGALSRTDRLDFQYSANAISLTTGNWVDADGLDFTAPVTSGATGALDGNLPANQSSVSGTINVYITNGSSFFIRWADFNGTGADDGLGVDDLTMTVSFTPASTHYFRSVQSGNWEDNSTWESSPDNILWAAATSTPTFNAATVTIRNTHTVTFSAFFTVDEVIINNGGILDYSNGILAVNDGVGDDIDIQNGGLLILSLAGNPPQFGSGSPTINVATGGILRVTAGGMTGVGTGVNANNYIYQHQSILELSVTFSSVGVTYFPNVNTTTIPIFRTINTGAILVGGGLGNNTIINGVYEANGTGLTTWQNAGDKIFRNGIRGSGNINGNTSGKFIINGTTAELGGTGTLIVPTIDGLEIGTSSTVTMISNKVVTGNISLLTNSYIDLGIFDLMVTGTVTGGSASSYIRTAGTGSLILNTVDAAGKLFPVGHSMYNPVTIENGSSHNWKVNINDSVVADIPHNTFGAVRVTWNIEPSINPPSSGADITFQFDRNIQTGHLFNVSPYDTPDMLQAWHRKQGYWLAAGTPNNLNQVSGSISSVKITGLTQFSPYGLSRILLPLPVKLNDFKVIQKNPNEAAISWTIEGPVSKNTLFEIQRSTDNIHFTTIASLPGNETSRQYNITDKGLPQGIIYYRLKITEPDGNTAFSRIVSLNNSTTGPGNVSLSPSVISSGTKLVFFAPDAEQVKIQVADITGKIWMSKLIHTSAGNNHLSLNLFHLPAGLYILKIYSSGNRFEALKFVRQ